MRAISVALLLEEVQSRVNCPFPQMEAFVCPSSECGQENSVFYPPGPEGKGPEQICPRRWLVPQNVFSGRYDEPLAVTHPSNKHCGYLPLGHVRACPGAQFAKIIRILHKFEVTPDSNSSAYSFCEQIY